MALVVPVEHHFACFYERRDDARDSKRLVHTHYHNSYLIWCTASRRVDEVIPSDHPRREVSRVIQWYGLIHEIYTFFP